MKVPIESVEKVLAYWQDIFEKRCKAVGGRGQGKTLNLMIFYTVSYLEHYIELLKETGREGDRMDNCKDCIHYDNSNIYKDTGYCHLWDDYMKDDDNCEHWEGD